MLISENKNVIKGTHNGQKFKLVGGILTFYGVAWDLENVKTLVELCNILKCHLR